MGTSYTLKDDEAIIYNYRNDSRYKNNVISFNRGQSFKIVKETDEFVIDTNAAISVTPSMALIVNDIDNATKGLTYNATTAQKIENTGINFHRYYCFDTGVSPQHQIELSKDIANYLDGNIEKYRADTSSRMFRSLVESREQSRLDFFGLYGGLFGLGIILSIVFIFAAVLIIYYKQISEGYEDQSRFDIMQKVGMTKKEIRKSINSQLLTVFFLPLIFAGMHLAFAAPIIKKLLLLFNLTNLNLFIVTILISFAAFALFYMIVYKITSNAYYKIVSGAKEE